MKKILIGLFISLILFSNFVSAFNFDIGNIFQQSVQGVQDASRILISPFFGGEDNLLFEKILLFLIIVSIIKVTLAKTNIFGDDNRLGILVAFAVALLATRFLSDIQTVQNVLLPYSILGIAISAAIPLMIFFYFIQSFESSIIRKVGWIFFVVIFIGLWNMRADELGNLAWIYLITGVIAFFFMLFDGTIRRALINQEWEQLEHENREKYEIDIRRQISQLRNDLANDTSVNKKQYIKMIKRLQKKLEAIHKN